MMLYRNREKFIKEEKMLGALFSRLPLSPDAWTLLSVVSALVSAYFIYNELYLEAVLFFALASVSDLADGSVARSRGIATSRGAYIDTIADRYVEFIILFALYRVSDSLFILDAKTWLVLAIFGSIMTTYAKAAAKEKSHEIRGGIMERAERMILLFAIIVSSHLFPAYTVYLISALAVLTNITAFQRISIALKQKKPVLVKKEKRRYHLNLMNT